MRRERERERDTVVAVFPLQFSGCTLCTCMNECLCVSVTETLLYSRWLLGLRKGIFYWGTDLTDILCAPQITWICLCVCNVRLYPWWRVQGNQLFLNWSGSITSHPGLHLRVIPLIALLLDILKLTLKPKSTLVVCPLLLSPDTFILPTI